MRKTAQFVELTLPDRGRPLLVNVNEISCILDDDNEKVVVRLRDGEEMVTTRPTYAEWSGGDIVHVFTDWERWRDFDEEVR